MNYTILLPKGCSYFGPVHPTLTDRFLLRVGDTLLQDLKYEVACALATEAVRQYEKHPPSDGMRPTLTINAMSREQ